jgi:cytochrome c peroxidase
MMHPYKSDALKPFHFIESEKDDLIEFLNSLTDKELLKDPRWSDPWPAQTGAQR